MTKKIQNWIVDRSTARDFTVCKDCNHEIIKTTNVIGFFFIKFPYFRISKRCCLLTWISFNHKKLLVFNLSIWFQWPCRVIAFFPKCNNSRLCPFLLTLTESERGNLLIIRLCLTWALASLCWCINCCTFLGF